MMLTNTQIKNAKPGERAVKLFDGGGLYLEISPSGGKLWRLKYRFDGCGHCHRVASEAVRRSITSFAVPRSKPVAAAYRAMASIFLP